MMRFRGISIWKVGVAVMGVVLITFLNGSGVTASTTQGWQVSIGGQTFSVSDNSAGMTLFQGRLTQEIVRDEAGNIDTQSVCNGFPSVEAARSINDNSDHSIELYLDMDNCRITVDNVSSSEIGIFDALVAGSSSESHEEHWGRAIVKAESGRGAALTQSKVMIDYASSLTVYDSRHICEVQSPAWIIGIRWHKNRCTSSPVTHHGSYIKAKTTGEFYATRRGDVWNESIHSSSAEIKGYSSHYTITCKWWPRSIKYLRFGGLTVKLICEDNER